MSLDDLDLSGLLESSSDEAGGFESTAGRPLDIPLDLIDEDPNQPRKEDNAGFSKESLNQLAASIEARGVKTPISIRNHPTDEGRFMINHGARRYRGSKIAKKTTIPAIIDNDYTDFDKAIENMQREKLNSREYVNWVGYLLAAGHTKAEVARNLGFSQSWVTQYSAMLDLPEILAQLFYYSGRCEDVTVISELNKLLKKHSEIVEPWINDESQAINRETLSLLKDFIKHKDSKTLAAKADAPSQPGVDSEEEQEEIEFPSNASDENVSDEKAESKSSKSNSDKAEEEADKFKKAIVNIMYQDMPGRLKLDMRPDTIMHGWIKLDDTGEVKSVLLSDLTIQSITEG